MLSGLSPHSSSSMCFFCYLVQKDTAKRAFEPSPHLRWTSFIRSAGIQILLQLQSNEATQMLPACSFHSQSAVSHRSTWELIHTREYILETMILKSHLHSRTYEVCFCIYNFSLVNKQLTYDLVHKKQFSFSIFFWICQGAMFTLFRLNHSFYQEFHLEWHWPQKTLNQKICRHESTYGLLQTASRCLSLPRASFSPHLKEDPCSVPYNVLKA